MGFRLLFFAIAFVCMCYGAIRRDRNLLICGTALGVIVTAAVATTL